MMCQVQTPDGESQREASTKGDSENSCNVCEDALEVSTVSRQVSNLTHQPVVSRCKRGRGGNRRMGA